MVYSGEFWHKNIGTSFIFIVSVAENICPAFLSPQTAILSQKSDPQGQDCQKEWLVIGIFMWSYRSNAIGNKDASLGQTRN